MWGKWFLIASLLGYGVFVSQARQDAARAQHVERPAARADWCGRCAR